MTSRKLSGVRTSEVVSPSFYRVHSAIKSKTHTSFWLKGGRGSTKSSFAAIEVVLGIMSDDSANALVLRKVADTTNKSTLPMILWAIDVLGVTHKFSHTKSPAQVTYLPTGQLILFSGLDDPRKLKSIKVRKGYLKILWFEEAEEFSGMKEIRNVEQSVMRAGDDFVELVTYNPPNDPNAWVNKEADDDDDPMRLVHHSTYLDVNPDWLGQAFIYAAERLKKKDREAYNHEYLGMAVGRAEQIVFHGRWEVRDFKTPPAHDCYQGRYFYGADWGFASDPTAITRSFIRDNCLYIDYEAGGVGIDIDDTPATFDRIPDVRKWPINADSARPETISYMKRNGFNIKGAAKWKDSKIEGVEYLKSFDAIYIHPRCKQTIKEFETLTYKVDKNTQEILPVIIEKNDHYFDSVRYALVDYIKKKVSIFEVVG